MQYSLLLFIRILLSRFLLRFFLRVVLLLQPIGNFFRIDHPTAGIFRVIRSIVGLDQSGGRDEVGEDERRCGDDAAMPQIFVFSNIQ